jgi:UDP-glucose 4-epimerase
LKILITGGAGYIGSVLSHLLIKLKHEIIIVDNLSAKNKNSLPPKAKFYKSDFSNIKLLNQIYLKHKFDTVIHLAASIDAGKSLLFLEDYYENNFIKSKVLIDWCVTKKIKRFIFSSTAAVYKPINTMITEESLVSPQSPYGSSKLFVEYYLNHIGQKYQFNYNILRFFNVVGADLYNNCGPNITHSDHLFNNISKAIFLKRPIYIYGKHKTKDHSPIRDFIDVNYLTSCIAKILKNKKQNKILNISCGKSFSVKKIINLFIIIAKKKLRIVHNNKKRPGDISSLICSNKKITTICKNEINISQTIKEHYYFVKKRYYEKNR